MSIFRGINCFTEGVSLALSPKMRPYVLRPALVSLVIIATGLGFGLSYVEEFSNYLISSLPTWLGFLEWILAPLMYLMGLLVGAWSFGLLAAIIGSPFLGELSMQVEQLKTEPVPWFKQIAPALMRELRKLGYHLPRLLMLVVISIIPVINTIAPLLWLGFGAWMMSAQFCDYSTENRSQDFKQTLKIMSRNRGASLGFGACVTIAMSIPLVNFFVAPAAAAGGTLLMQSLRGNHDA